MAPVVAAEPRNIILKDGIMCFEEPSPSWTSVSPMNDNFGNSRTIEQGSSRQGVVYPILSYEAKHNCEEDGMDRGTKKTVHWPQQEDSQHVTKLNAMFNPPSHESNDHDSLETYNSTQRFTVTCGIVWVKCFCCSVHVCNVVSNKKIGKIQNSYAFSIFAIMMFFIKQSDMNENSNSSFCELSFFFVILSFHSSQDSRWQWYGATVW